MPEVKLSDGRVVTFPEGMSQDDMAAALRVLPDANGRNPNGTYGQPPEGMVLNEETGQMVDTSLPINAPKTSLMEQIGSGANEGIAAFAGMPVDAMTWALNKGIGGINNVAGTDIGKIENPVGGSQNLTGALDPFISDVAPQTNAQQWGRRVGQEVGPGVLLGAGIPALTAGMAGPIGAAGQKAISSFPSFLASDVATDVGAGTGAYIANEIAPDSATADIVGALLGGGATLAGINAVTPSPKAPTLDELRQRQTAAYDTVDNSTAQLTPQSTDALTSNIAASVNAAGIDDVLNPRAARMMELLPERTGQPMGIPEMENIRRIVGRDVAGALDPGDARLGMVMKDEISSYLDNLKSGDVVPGTGSTDEVIEALQEGRDVTRRIKGSEILDTAIDRAERQAARSGTGGNVMNTVRQRVDAILNNPKQLRTFSEADIAAMRDIVKGTPTRNALRMAARFSPTSGNLAATSALAQGVGAATVNPLLAAPAVTGMAAKTAGEMLDARMVSKLSEQIRNGGPVPKPQNANSAIIQSLLLQQLSGLEQQ